LYWVVRWAESDRASWLVLGSAAVALGILLKLTGLYVGIPVAYVFCKKYGRNVHKMPAVWAAVAAMLLPSVLWYWHAHTLYVKYDNTFGILDAGYMKFGSVALLCNVFFYQELARHVILYHLTPLFFLGFGFGVYLLWGQRNWLML